MKQKPMSQPTLNASSNHGRHAIVKCHEINKRHMKSRHQQEHSVSTSKQVANLHEEAPNDKHDASSQVKALRSNRSCQTLLKENA